MNKIERIKNYDVSFHTLVTEFNEWICAYVNLKGELKEEYEFETYREDNVIGLDTNFGSESSKSLMLKYEIAIKQITIIIDKHEKFKNDKD